MNNSRNANMTVEVLGYHEHNGVTKVKMFKQPLVKRLHELEALRIELGNKEEYEIYFMFRQK